MISFDSSKVHKTKNGGLYLSYSQIESFTEQIIMDYDKSLLSSPKAIQYDDFLESYLGVNIDYQYIYTSCCEDLILGCAIFNNQCLKVFDKDNMRTSEYWYSPISVILDRSLIDGERTVSRNITGLHEGGHVWLHREQFTDTPGQMKLGLSNGRISCRKSAIGATESYRNNVSNDEMWREIQANIFAVTMAMPRSSMEIAVGEIFNEYGIKSQLVVDSDSMTRELSEHIIPARLGALYDMSKESVRNRLYKLGYYITKIKYEEEHKYNQLSLFDLI